MARPGRSVSAVVSALLAGAMIAACGSVAPSATNHPRLTAQASGLDYARCMRSHRVGQFRDPSASGGFNLSASGIDQSSPTVRSAERACRSLLPVKRPPSVRPTAAAYARLLRWARCMRAHGISGLPDPKPNPPPSPDAAGSSPYRTVMGDGGYWVGIPTAVNAHSDAFIHLATRCGEAPQGHR